MSFPPFPTNILQYCHYSKNVPQIRFPQTLQVSQTFRPPFLLQHVWLQLCFPSARTSETCSLMMVVFHTVETCTFLHYVSLESCVATEFNKMLPGPTEASRCGSEELSGKDAAVCQRTFYWAVWITAVTCCVQTGRLTYVLPHCECDRLGVSDM